MIGLGCLPQFSPFHVKRIGRWYCSEWIAYGLRLAGVIHKVYAHADLSPQKLYDLIVVEERTKKRLKKYLLCVNNQMTWRQSNGKE